MTDDSVITTTEYTVRVEGVGWVYRTDPFLRVERFDSYPPVVLRSWGHARELADEVIEQYARVRAFDLAEKVRICSREVVARRSDWSPTDDVLVVFDFGSSEDQSSV